ncbi:hypothetical protein [Sphaerisporangium corydalis]|uniref:ESX-1 secretion-associated protein n=1 Tax=Sphaerisporangium corydalis TaxID=1441875 RepID=A0ABV9EB24_9ACTN|nr:hypothetical protein [Sphaerisporangium corydalis]
MPEQTDGVVEWSPGDLRRAAAELDGVTRQVGGMAGGDRWTGAAEFGDDLLGTLMRTLYERKAGHLADDLTCLTAAVSDHTDGLLTMAARQVTTEDAVLADVDDVRRHLRA